jgi:hypothetical protein
MDGVNNKGCCCCCGEDENDDVDDGGGSGECRGFGDRDDGGLSVRRSKCDNNFSTCSAPR